MTFSIIVGLGLDYDVFLISRVLEFRLRGYTNKASIVKGLYKTGHIITAAGIIMAVAFFGIVINLRDHIESSSLLLGCDCSFGHFGDQNYLSSSSSWIVMKTCLVTSSKCSRWSQVLRILGKTIIE